MFEFKENWLEAHDIGKYISALSNSVAICRKDFPCLIWGIHDDNHEIIGTKFDFRKNVKNEPLEHYLSRQLT